jgi:hypothetical protein
LGIAFVPQGLLWRRGKSYLQEPESDSDRAPSWSWTALDGEIVANYDHRNKRIDISTIIPTSVCKLLKAYWNPDFPQSSTDIGRGYLVLYGPILEVTEVPTCHSEVEMRETESALSSSSELRQRVGRFPEVLTGRNILDIFS